MKFLEAARHLSLFSAFLIFTGLAQPLAAAPYRLVAGDTLEMLYGGAETPMSAVVDLDGQVRVPDVGSLDLQGLTLDAAETALADALVASGMYVDPQVSLRVSSYAPIIVSGDVVSPGRYDYSPGMTAAAAVAVAGGSQANGLTRYEVMRARNDAEGQIETLNLQIAATVAEIARFEAALADAEEVRLPDHLQAQIPLPQRVDLASLLQREQAMLDTETQRARDLRVFWENEIETIDQQKALFAQRIAVQEEIVASSGRVLEDARSLQERGLQTTAGLVSAEQRSADARSNLLSLESAQIQATQSIANAQRERTRFFADQHAENLRALQQGRVALEDLTIRYQRTETQLGLLRGGSSGGLLSPEALDVQYVLSSTRPDRASTDPVSPGTTLLPGDTLVISVRPLVLDEEQS